MNEFDLISFIVDEAIILIPALLVVAEVIKRTGIVAKRFLPVILLGVGVSLTVAMLGPSIENVVQGILISGAAVFSYEIYKGTVKKKKPNA